MATACVLVCMTTDPEYACYYSVANCLLCTKLVSKIFIVSDSDGKREVGEMLSALLRLLQDDISSRRGRQDDRTQSSPVHKFAETRLLDNKKEVSTRTVSTSSDLFPPVLSPRSSKFSRIRLPKLQQQQQYPWRQQATEEWFELTPALLLGRLLERLHTENPEDVDAVFRKEMQL